VQGGVIVLTKVDLIDDPEWLDLIEADVHQAAEGTVLEDAPIVRVSAKKDSGLKELVNTLQAVLASHQPRPDLGRPRLPVDRVFSMPGFGTVITGTLTGGSFKVGDEVECLPSGLRGRIRGLQSHNLKENAAVPGSRTAMNISGLDVDQIRRGDTVVRPGTYQTTRRLDAEFRLLPDASAPVRHDDEVKLFIHTQEVVARLRLIGSEEISPGSSGWLQLELTSPVVAQRGDRYILRRPSPGETLGGGVVLDPHPARRHKRFSEAVIRQMEAYQRGTPAEILQQAAQTAGVMSLRELVKKSGLGSKLAAAAISELISGNQLIVIEPGDIQPTADILAASTAWYQARQNQMAQMVEAYHRANPLRAGMPREELKSRLKEDGRIFIALLKHAIQSDSLVETGALVRTAVHRVRFTASQQGRVDSLIQRFATAPFSPPSLKEIQEELGIEITEVLLANGTLKKVSPEVVFRIEDYDEMLRWVREILSGGGTLTVAQFRDQFSTSRKYALAFLEHLDTTGVTIRHEDARSLKNSRG
jgi:selenocysteine-specific elongation factor